MPGYKSIVIALMVVCMAVTGWSAVFAATPEPAAEAQPAATEEPLEVLSDMQGSIVVYTALEDDQLAEYMKIWEAQYPNIDVQLVRDSTGIVTAKLLAEKENPQADAVWGLAVTSLLLADTEGMLAPYAPAGLDTIAPEFRDPSDPPVWVGIDAWFSAFCANTVDLEAKNLPMPASWADLTNPAYAGQIVMPNPASSGTGYLSVSAILQMMGEEDGWKFLDALDKNIAIYTHSGSKPCKLAGAGEYAIGISFDYRAIKQKAAGEPIAPVFPTEGSGWDIEANALVKKAEINPAAKLFLDWAISPPLMREYAKNFPVTAATTGIAIPEGYPADPLAQLAPNDFQMAAASRDSVLQEWTVRYDAKSEPKQ